MIRSNVKNILNYAGIIIGIIWLIVTFLILKRRNLYFIILLFELSIVFFILIFVFREKISLEWHKQQRRLAYPIIEKFFGKKAVEFIYGNNAIKKFEYSIIVGYFVGAIIFILLFLILHK